MEVVDIVERDEKRQPTAHIYADFAEWDDARREWILTNGKIIEHLLPNERPTPPMNVAAYRSTSRRTNGDLPRRRTRRLLSTNKAVNQDAAAAEELRHGGALITKHFRMAQFFVNITLLLLAIPCVLTRDPGGLKGGALKCLILTGSCLGAVFLARHIASMPPPGTQWIDMWPAIWACVPLFIFLPLAIYLLDRRARIVVSFPRGNGLGKNFPPNICTPEDRIGYQWCQATTHLMNTATVINRSLTRRSPSHFLATPAGLKPGGCFFFASNSLFRRLFFRTTQSKGVTMRMTALGLAAALAASTCAQNTQPAGDSKFALTVYSTADPATFDPKELARQTIDEPLSALSATAAGLRRSTRDALD